MTETTTREAGWVAFQGAEPPVAGDRVSIDGVDVILVALEPRIHDGVVTFSITTRPVTDAD